MIADIEATAWMARDCGFATGAGALDANFDVIEAVAIAWRKASYCATILRRRRKPCSCANP